MESIIRAPAAGTILTRAVNPGDPITPLTSYQPGTELATIADMSDLIFKGTVDEIDVGKLHVGLPARIKVGALPTDVVTGHVSRIAPQAQQKDGATLFDVEIELERVREDGAASRLLGQRGPHHPGEEGRADRPRARGHRSRTAARRPSSSCRPRSPRTSRRRSKSSLGISDGLNAEVVSGLKKGAKVVERPPKKITSAVD